MLKWYNNIFGFSGNQSPKWLYLTLLVTLIIAIPVIVVLSYLFIPAGQAWQHIYTNLLGSYVLNTFLLMLGVGIITMILGVSTAWLVTMYHFPGHRFFEWGLILPLSLPAYIAAYTYAGMLDYTGTAYTFLRNNFGLDSGQYLLFDIMTLQGAVFVMGLVFYPYVYVITRSYFMQQSASFLEVSGSLGQSPLRAFFKVALPLARPAIAGGVTLALMEVLNDYGTVSYYGLDTFTIGIFTAWFSFGDPNAALKLSSYLLIFVLLLIGLERYQRGKANFELIGTQYSPPKVYRLSGTKAFMAFLVCAIPFFLGFLLPVIQLFFWSYQTAASVVNAQFFKLVANSFLLALVASLLCMVIAILLAYTMRLYKSKFSRFLSRVATLGYAIPGAVIAVGVMIPFTYFDNQLNRFLESTFSVHGGLILSGTLVTLVFAYVVRFLAVSFNTLESGFDKISTSLDEASRSLGAPPSKTLFSVNIPLLKGTIISAGILVFIDVLKELPLTLILRPFNFDTLAIKAFEFANDEMLAESSNAALVIVATGIIPVYLLNKMITKGKL